MRNTFDIPTSGNVTYPDGSITPWWLQWVQSIHSAVTASKSSGTTAQRPTNNIWIGRRYFDTTLGKPVFVKTASPVVWVDASGAVV
jgi:hypothetical protein